MSPDELRFEALGSSCHLLGVGLERGRLEEGAAWVAEMHRRFSRFHPDSELSRFNARAGHQVEVSPELEAVGRGRRAKAGRSRWGASPSSCGTRGSPPAAPGGGAGAGAALRCTT